MRVLVTGGAGYVGSTLIPQLLADGNEVRLIDSLVYGADSILPLFRYRSFEFVEADVRDAEAMRSACQGVDVIVHLAAIVGFPACARHPDLARSVNVGGVRNLIQATSRQQLILFASTGSTYGRVDGMCTEETALRPLSLYGETKALGERMLLDERTAICFRFATAFGVSPRMRLDLLVNDLTYKAATQGYVVVYGKECMRTFVHVYDMGRLFVFALHSHSHMHSDVFNVGSERMNLSKGDLSEIVRRETGAYVHYADFAEDTDGRDYSVSYRRIAEVGFATTIGVDQGVEELARAFRSLAGRPKLRDLSGPSGERVVGL